MTADVQRELAEVVEEATRKHFGSNYRAPNTAMDGVTKVVQAHFRAGYRTGCADLQALIADAEKWAAARALREAADSSDLRMSYATRELLRHRAAALDPSGAAEGAGR